VLSIIYLACVKPFILKIDNQIEIFNTWAFCNVLVMVISIGGVTSDLSV